MGSSSACGTVAARNERIAAAYSAGEDVAAIAARENLSPKSIKPIASRANGHRPWPKGRKRNLEREEEVCAGYDAGVPVSVLAKQCQISRAGVRKILDRNGIFRTSGSICRSYGTQAPIFKRHPELNPSTEVAEYLAIDPRPSPTYAISKNLAKCHETFIAALSAPSPVFPIMNNIRPCPANPRGRDRAPADCASIPPKAQRTAYCRSSDLSGGSHA